MRVLQVYDHISISSGITTVIMQWYRKVYKEVQFDFLVCKRTENSFENEINKLGGKVFYLDVQFEISNSIKLIQKVKKFMNINASEYDIIHLHSGILSFPFLYFAKKYGIKKRIVHVHSADLGNTKLSSLRNRLLIIPMKKYANIYIACSKKAAKEWYEKIKIKNYIIVGNGICFNNYRFDKLARKKIREKFNLDEKTIALVHISNMTQIKNITFLLNVFYILKNKNKKINYKLFFIGKEKIDEKYNKFLLKNNLSEDVINLGIRNDINLLLQGMDLCLMPSIKEGFGMVPIEAQANGLPVIVSEGFPKDIIITNIINRLPLKEEKWVEKVSECNNQRNSNFKFKDNANDYDIDDISEKILKIYNS